MPIIDTHAHLYLKEFHADIGNVIERSQQAGVVKILLPDLDKATRPQMVKLYENYSSFFSMMAGIHPTSVKADYQQEIKSFDDFLKSHYSFCGIGEIGIDLYWDETFKNEQIEVFEYQLDVASKQKLPVSIHQRNSVKLVLNILKTYRGKLTGVLHCFSGDIQDAKEAIDLGFYLGVGGVITYKHNNLVDIVRTVGIEHLLLETDAPYLPPVPHRGRRNEPAFLTIVLQTIASLVNKDVSLVEEVLYQNTIKLFPHV